MSVEKTLKQENLRYVQTYTIFLIVISWFFVQRLSVRDIFHLANTVNDWIEKLLSATLLAAIAYIVTVILSGFLSSKIKYILVFWRLKHTLPGHRSFSQLMAQDTRIDAAVIAGKYGELPQEPEMQNRLWYRIYKQYELDKTVLEAQKNFLLMREITAITVIFIPVFTATGLFILSDFRSFFFYLLFLLVIAAVTATAGRNYGEQLVLNVMAAASIQ